ncbi:PfkB family carbohydrate kinase [Saxibacter everestensis]|uniref:PfkB family carbohydrate kinase n=1 Tax=Saxibacter everestensis TaxID=2909229 RepID=A0ABY8QPI5_9MICO|nr:PfkB family carbohydrate kinase [Brevibacteriaceae bacterium ZFBP1038]
MTRTLVIGDALIDEVRTNDGNSRFPGGAALNLAVGLSILDLRAGLVTCVGDDMDGEWLRSYLEQNDVATFAAENPLGTGVAISDRTESEPRYEFNEAMVNRFVDVDSDVCTAASRSDLVAINSFPFDNAAQLSALDTLLDSTSALIAVDPNPRPGLVRDIDAFRDGFEHIARRSGVAKISSEDAEMLYGKDIDQVGNHVIGLGARAVLLTAGRDGARVVTRKGDAVSCPIANLPGPIVDTMGAGDAALAALLKGIVHRGSSLDSQDWAKLLQFAMLVAAATCREVGAQLQVPDLSLEAR